MSCITPNGENVFCISSSLIPFVKPPQYTVQFVGDVWLYTSSKVGCLPLCEGLSDRGGGGFLVDLTHNTKHTIPHTKSNFAFAAAATTIKKQIKFTQLSSLTHQLVLMDREPNHCPFMACMAFSASAFFTNETKAYPFDFNVCGSRTIRQLDISPNGAKASRNVSVSISGDRSPTNM